MDIIGRVNTCKRFLYFLIDYFLITFPSSTSIGRTIIEKPILSAIRMNTERMSNTCGIDAKRTFTIPVIRKDCTHKSPRITSIFRSLISYSCIRSIAFCINKVENIG